VVPLDFTGMISYQSLIVTEAEFCTVSEILRHIQRRYVWLPLLRLTPGAGVPLKIFVKWCMEVSGWLEYKMS